MRLQDLKHDVESLAPGQCVAFGVARRVADLFEECGPAHPYASKPEYCASCGGTGVRPTKLLYNMEKPVYLEGDRFDFHELARYLFGDGT